MKSVNDLLVWVDCEMTGLDSAGDKLIEVAALVTDPDLTVLGEGVDVVIHAEDALLDGMLDVVAPDAPRVRAHRRRPGVRGQRGRGRGAWSWRT